MGKLLGYVLSGFVGMVGGAVIAHRDRAVLRRRVADSVRRLGRGRRSAAAERMGGASHNSADLLTDKQKTRLQALFADDAHIEVEATWGIYKRMIAAYRHANRGQGRDLMVRLIASVSSGVPKALSEVIKLGQTLTKRAADALAYFDHPRTSNGPTEAIRRLEHLRGSALGFRNLTNYVARSLLETGGFRPRLHPQM